MRTRATDSVFLSGRVAVNARSLRRGLALLFGASRRSLASFHPRAAEILASGPPAVTETIRFLLAGSFVQYLYERHGMGRLARFSRCAETDGIEGAARAAFGRPWEALRAEWEEMLRSLEL